MTNLKFYSKIEAGEQMRGKQVVVLEIGSSQLRVIVAKPGLNDSLFVKDQAEKNYDGYYQGEFVEPSKLAPALYDLFSSIDFLRNKYNKKLFVALPAEMTNVALASASMSVEGLGRVTKGDVDALSQQALEKVKAPDVEIVSTSPFGFYVDDVKSPEPVGKKGRTLSAEFSIITCPAKLVKNFNEILADLGFVSVEYISEPLASALTVVPEEEREEGALVIDVGHLSTSVAYISGGGLSSLTSFSIGGGHITSDLSEAFDLTFENAERLKKMVVISVEAQPLDYYDLITAEGKVERILQDDAGKVVSYRLETIASAINQCLIMQGISLGSYLPIYLIGGGASKIKGGKDFLAKCISKNIAYGRAPFPGKDKPEEATLFSLASFVLKNCD